ncbi:unnamed protein product [Lactuca saligna]|uniref:Uncharacterized protein n=1 Tax=Lactuca saligna TaxID=75948 RepID=A0AA36A441_LACSI|nr:unnamed protein product [Lactuca saligna]
MAVNLSQVKSQKVSKKHADSSSSKVVKKSKKQDESSPPPIVAKKPEETVLAPRTGVFKKLKKKARPSSPAYMVKPQINRKGLVIDDESTEEDVILESPVRDSPIISNVEMPIPVITTVEPSQVSTPEPIVLTPPVVYDIETSHDQGTSIVIYSTFDNSMIDTSTTLPPFASTLIITHSPTFDNILDQPITSLFSSQSTDPPVTLEDEQIPTDGEENEFDGTFDDIQYDLEEENIPDNRILIGK